MAWENYYYVRTINWRMSGDHLNNFSQDLTDIKHNEGLKTAAKFDVLIYGN